MASLNKPRSSTPVHTHEGATASRVNPLETLRRTVMACMLWESTFYEDGENIADRIKRVVPLCDPVNVAHLALEARGPMRLRHVPLLLVRELARHPLKPKVADVLKNVIQRVDEITEFVSIYWKDGKQPLSKQVKLGLAGAFGKFNEYQLAKYNRPTEVRLRDVLFMIHAKPKDDEQAALWKRLAEDTLATPDTWEVALSKGGDKGKEFTRLLTTSNLGYMALMRNLRNMEQTGVDRQLIKAALVKGAKTSKALPFRFIAAAKAAPSFLLTLDAAMSQAMEGMKKLPGMTNVLVDVSASMGAQLSGRSKMSRREASSGLAMLLAGMCEDVRIFTFSERTVEVMPVPSLALADTIQRSQPNSCTMMGQAIKDAALASKTAVRTICITDEQSHDTVGGPLGRGYILNVGSFENGVAYGPWTHINGFSDQCVRFIMELEKSYADS